MQNQVFNSKQKGDAADRILNPSADKQENERNKQYSRYNRSCGIPVLSNKDFSRYGAIIF